MSSEMEETGPDALPPDPLMQADPWYGASQGPTYTNGGEAAASSSAGVVPGSPQAQAPDWTAGWDEPTQGFNPNHGGELGYQTQDSWGDWQGTGYEQWPAGGSQNYFGDNADQPGQRTIHDNPPTWDGKDPDRQLEPYLKLLEGWMATTRTLRKQRGMVILNYATGDLRFVINELDIDILTAEDGDRKVLHHIRESYQEYLDKRLPKAMEKHCSRPKVVEGKKNRCFSMWPESEPFSKNFRGSSVNCHHKPSDTLCSEMQD